jgi:hypothetical protein
MNDEDLRRDPLDRTEQQRRLESYGFVSPEVDEPGGQTPADEGSRTDPGSQEDRFPSTGSWTSPGYRSAGSRASNAQILYGILALTTVALAVVTTGGFELLDRAERLIWEEAAYESWSDNVDVIAGWQSIFAFIAGVSLIMWLSRFVDNVPPLGGGTPKRSPRRVILYWLVPVINIIFLPLIFNDVARRQSRDGAGHRTLILVWWLLFVFPLISLIWAVPVLLNPAGTDWARSILVLGIIERIAFAAQAVVTILMIRRLQRDEDFHSEHWISRPGATHGADPLASPNAPGAWGRGSSH